jgi:hypothetical protein
MVLQLDIGTADHRPVSVTSDEAARLLNALLGDNTMQIISRSQLRASDGMTSTLKCGDHQRFADAVCASPLTKHLRAGANFLAPTVNHDEIEPGSV